MPTYGCQLPPQVMQQQDEIRCVRSDFCEPCERKSLIWWVGGKKTKKKNAFGMHELRPSSRGIQASGVRAGTFIAEVNGAARSPFVCLRQKSFTTSYMPNLNQINRIMKADSPFIYFHPDETYLPCSVSWYFANGTQLYKQGDPLATQVHPSGCNLPQSSTASSDREYWLGLPIDNKNDKDKLVRGEIETSECYLHIKPCWDEHSLTLLYGFSTHSTAPEEPRLGSSQYP